MDKKLMRYIPKEYKSEVANIYRGEPTWNDYKKRWNTPLIVEWTDGKTNEYTNASWAWTMLSEIGGREGC